MRHSLRGMSTNPKIPSASAFSITPSRTVTVSGSPQSRQGAWTVMDLPGKSQQTASASNPHWANQFCFPSTVTRYWVGRLLNGAKEAM